MPKPSKPTWSPPSAGTCWCATPRARSCARVPRAASISIVCGDRVRCEPDRAHDEVLVVEVLPRRTLLARANLRGASEPVVANISQLVVVVAPLPAAGFLHRRPLPVRGDRGRHPRRHRDQQVRSRPLTIDAAELEAYAAAGYAHAVLLGQGRRGTRTTEAGC